MTGFTQRQCTVWRLKHSEKMSRMCFISAAMQFKYPHKILFEIAERILWGYFCAQNKKMMKICRRIKAIHIRGNYFDDLKKTDDRMIS